MNYIEFTKCFGQNSIIDIRNVITRFNGLDRRRLYEWQQKGYLTKIVNNFYMTADHPVNDHTLKIIASRIYQPSYIGLESALAYYNFIPEAVFQTISLTTKRNKFIRTKVGDFQYRAIKPRLFFGYNAIEGNSGSFYLSDPEKSLLDFFYFVPGSDRRHILDESRLNRDEINKQIDPEKMKRYLKIFNSQKVYKAVQRLEG